MEFPKWATPERRTHLVQLWNTIGLSCLQGHPMCSDLSHYTHDEHKAVTVAVRFERQCVNSTGDPIPGLLLEDYAVKQVPVTTTELIDAYALAEKTAISYWVEDDREERFQLWKLERRKLHANPKHERRGQFDSVARDIFMANQPLYTVVGVGVSPLNNKRVAKVIIPGLLKAILWVDLSGLEPEGGKNRHRKYLRYGKGRAPESTEKQIAERCRLAVFDYQEKALRA